LSVLLFLVCAAIFFILTTPLHRRKKAIAAFDPGDPLRRKVEENKPKEAEQGQVEFGDGVYWSPLSHPNPHVLIVGGFWKREILDYPATGKRILLFNAKNAGFPKLQYIP